MADKLTGSTWTAFTKKLKLDLDDGALVKALARLDKTSEPDGEARLAALDDLVEQGKKQVVVLTKRKKDLGDKVFGEVKDKLYALMDLAEAEAKNVKAAMAKAASDKASEEEEADSPVMLTSGMVPLLRQIAKGETMHALIGIAGKQAAVLIMRRPISPARRKLLSEYLGVPGVKFYPAECAGEGKTVGFLVENAAGGMAKKLRQALLEQTKLRLNVYVQLAGTDEIEEDQDEEEQGADATKGRGKDAKASAPAPERAAKGPATEAPGDAPAPAPQARADYAQRVRKLVPLVQDALRAKHPESTKLRALLGFASEKADAQQDLDGANKALDMVEKLLSAPAAPAAPAPAPAPAPRTVDPLTAFNARLAALAPRIKAAITANAPQAQDIKLKASEAGMHARKRQFPQAQALLDEAERLLARLSVPPTGSGPAAPPSAQDQPAPGRDANDDADEDESDEAEEEGDEDEDALDPAQALAHYQAARAMVLAQLDRLASAIGATGHRRADAALIEVKAVRANLSAKPDSLAAAKELERYLETDDVVTDVDGPNPFGISVGLQETMLPAVYDLIDALS